MPPRLMILGSLSDRRQVAEIRHKFVLEQLPAESLPRVSLQQRRDREDRRTTCVNSPNWPITIVDEGNGGQIKSFLDVQPEPTVQGREHALMMFGITREENRLEGSHGKCVNFAINYFDSAYLRACLPTKTFAASVNPAVSLVRSKGFKGRPWKQVCRVYEENDHSILGQAFWEAYNSQRLPFQFGEANELVLKLADETHLTDLTKLRLELARGLEYETHFERVEMGVLNLIKRDEAARHSSFLLVVMEGDRVVGAVRVSPSYEIWEGMTRLSIRDIVIAKSHQKRGLLPWVFNAAVIAGRMLIHPDAVVNPLTRVIEPLWVDTWLPNERLMRHFQQEVPRLHETGNSFFENV